MYQASNWSIGDVKDLIRAVRSEVPHRGLQETYSKLARALESLSPKIHQQAENFNKESQALAKVISILKDPDQILGLVNAGKPNLAVGFCLFELMSGFVDMLLSLEDDMTGPAVIAGLYAAIILEALENTFTYDEQEKQVLACLARVISDPREGIKRKAALMEHVADDNYMLLVHGPLTRFLAILLREKLPAEHVVQLAGNSFAWTIVNYTVEADKRPALENIALLVKSLYPSQASIAPQRGAIDACDGLMSPKHRGHMAPKHVES